uniref:HORMA domain-containing protein 1 n=1 Tax=Pelusios castaneus TaxID=367368 RepID=A0A8C8RRK4_9SAUR
MATAQMQRNSMSAVIFPNKISTEQQSLILVKRLLAVSVSCITYLRGIFPECAYGTRYLDDLCVKILREDKNCPGSSQLVKWMLGCYDALQKKYVSLLTVTECYQFKFKYTNKGPVMDFTSKNKGNDSDVTCTDTKKASILLIRKIYVLMQNLGPLPNDVCLTMKLFYYDEVTPPDYQPPGFKEGDCDTMIFEGEPMYLNVGEVPTPFHMLKVKVTTEKQRMENIDKSVLKQGDSNVPTQLIGLDKDDPEEQDQQINVRSVFPLNCAGAWPHRGHRTPRAAWQPPLLPPTPGAAALPRQTRPVPGLWAGPPRPQDGTGRLRLGSGAQACLPAPCGRGSGVAAAAAGSRAPTRRPPRLPGPGQGPC